MPSGSRKCTLGSVAGALLLSGILFILTYKFGKHSGNSLSLILGILFTIVGFFLSCVAFLVYVSKEDDKDAPPHDDNNGADLYSQHSSEYNTGNQSPRDQNFSYYRDGNRFIPLSDRHGLSASTPDPAPDSALPVIHSEDYSESRIEMGSSSGAASPRNGSPSGAHPRRSSSRSPVDDTTNTFRPGSQYMETIPTQTNRSPHRTPIPSPRLSLSTTPVDDLSVDLDGVFANIDNVFSDITGRREDRNSELFVPPDYRSVETSQEPSAPPPSYQEVIEGGFPELSRTYQHTVLHSGQSGSSNE